MRIDKNGNVIIETRGEKEILSHAIERSMKEEENELKEIYGEHTDVEADDFDFYSYCEETEDENLAQALDELDTEDKILHALYRALEGSRSTSARAKRSEVHLDSCTRTASAYNESWGKETEGAPSP